MRIAFLLNGMTGYLAAELAALRDRGHELLVVTPGSPEQSVGAMADTAFGDLGTERHGRVIAWRQEPDAASLVGTVRRFAPDAVLMTSWNFADSYRATMKAVAGSAVRILIMDNLWRATPRQWLGRATHRWYVDTVADVVMVPSDRTEFYARRLGFGPEDVIRGSLTADTGLFSSEPRSGEELAGRRSFLMVSRLVEHKGADLIAEAYSRYRAASSDPWELHVVGIGPLQPVLRDRPGVIMHGFLQPPAVAELMRAVSCYVLPSRIEPYGVVLHEATSSALPVLSSDFAGAVPAFVQDGANGWTVPSGDVEEWAAALGRMSALSAERLGSMSEISVALSRRLSPAIWARNLEESIVRRRASG
jgi:glycosyltransferase involved in cell wall biosynthesis